MLEPTELIPHLEAALKTVQDTIDYLKPAQPMVPLTFCHMRPTGTPGTYRGEHFTLREGVTAQMREEERFCTYCGGVLIWEDTPA